MLNQVVFVGRICKDPELKETENGKKVSNITLAVSRSYKNEDGVYDTDFIDCTLWGGVAENITNYCKKGDLIGIKGRVETKEVKTNKTKHTEPIIVADKVTFLTSKKETEKDDDIDF